MREPIDGVLGLARPNGFYYSIYEEAFAGLNHGPLYTNEMYDQGVIDTRTVSFYYNGRSGTSYVDFGTPQTSAMSNANDIVYFGVLDRDLFWSTFNQGVGIGSTESSYTFGYGAADAVFSETIDNGSVYSIFDTGLGGILISAPYHADLIKYIFRYVGGDEYQIEQGQVFTRCYSNFPPLYFMFQNKWLKVDVDDYVVDRSDAQDASICQLLIFALDAPYNIFGTPIFQGYYSIHEQD